MKTQTTTSGYSPYLVTGGLVAILFASLLSKALHLAAEPVIGIATSSSLYIWVIAGGILFKMGKISGYSQTLPAFQRNMIFTIAMLLLTFLVAVNINSDYTAYLDLVHPVR